MRHVAKGPARSLSVLFVLLFCLPALAGAKYDSLLDEPITGSSAVPALAHLKQHYRIPNFKLGGKYNLGNPASYEFGGEDGVTLESLGVDPLRVGYIAVGTPHRDENGQIDNAVIISSYYSGDATNMYLFWYKDQPGNSFSKGSYVGPGQLIDTDKYYVVFLDALGLWGTSKPSEGLGPDFPDYNLFDAVQANYRLLKDHLNISRVRLATGVSMGGSQSYAFAVMHPDYVEAIMPIGGTTTGGPKDPVAHWTFLLMDAAVMSDPVYQETQGYYYDRPKSQHPNQGMMFGWSVLNLNAFDLDFRVTQDWKDVAPNVFYWNPPEGAGTSLQTKADEYDVNDILARNLASGPLYDMDEKLHLIKAKTLALHVTTDQWLIYSRAQKTVDKIEHAELVGYPSPLAHYAIFRGPNTVRDEVERFFRLAGLDGREYHEVDIKPASVDANPSPGKSFWTDHVHYPFEVKYRTGTDDRGVQWEIAYMDEYLGEDPNPDTLVIVHGKGANAAHYGHIMELALQNGMRVIAPDMPHYGKSAPGNLDRPQARTLDDIRAALHDVIVKQLGVKKAYYFGHSLGGQVVMGYALNYPDSVAGLVLEAPSGLEEFPRNLNLGDGKTLPVFDPGYAHDFETWKKTWAPLGVLQREMARDEETIRLFETFKKKDPNTGEVVDADAGYFLNYTPYARFLTETRVGLTKGNPQELEQHVNAFIYDVYSIGSELLRDEPNNLYRRLTELDTPIFLTFGDQEPFIPSTKLNGLQDLENDVIAPFVKRMRAAGNPPVLKVYPGAAHFIHTDVPNEYALDVVDFIRTGKVEGETTLAELEAASAVQASAGKPAASNAPSGANAFSK